MPVDYSFDLITSSLLSTKSLNRCSEEVARGMSERFNEHTGQVAFKPELRKDQKGYEQICGRGSVDGNPQTFDANPCTGFWKRFGIDFMRIGTIETQVSYCGVHSRHRPMMKPIPR